VTGYFGFNANNSFTFQAFKKLTTHAAYLWSGLFCKFFGDFLVLGDRDFAVYLLEYYTQRAKNV